MAFIYVVYLWGVAVFVEFESFVNCEIIEHFVAC